MAVMLAVIGNSCTFEPAPGPISRTTPRACESKGGISACEPPGGGGVAEKQMQITVSEHDRGENDGIVYIPVNAFQKADKASSL